MTYNMLPVMLALALSASPGLAQEGTRLYPTTIPALTNKAEMRAVAAAEAARILEPGDSTLTVLRLLLDRGGVPIDVIIQQSTGRPSVDSAAVRVGKALRFGNVHPDDAPLLIQMPIAIFRRRANDR